MNSTENFRGALPGSPPYNMRMNPRFPVVFAICATLAGCAGFDPHNVFFRDGSARASQNVPVPAVAGPLDAETRRAALDFVWATINDRYYKSDLNGVDWRAARERHEKDIMTAPDDEAFWERLDRLTGELKDSHTRVHSPKQWERQRRNQSVSFGFGMTELSGEWRVTRVHPEGDAYWAGVRAGMLVEKIDGVPAAEHIAKAIEVTRDSSTPWARRNRAVGRILSGEPDTSMRFRFVRSDGSAFEATLKRRPTVTPPRVVSRTLPSGLGYVQFSQWSPTIQSAVLRAIDEQKKAPGMIVDVRDNPGGSAIMVKNLLEQFFDKDQESGSRVTRTGKPISFMWGLVNMDDLERKLRGRKDAYTKPVVVLVSEGSGSASELFSSTMQDLDRAQIVGQRTCGCLLAYLGYATIPGGGALAYSEMGFSSPKNRIVEGSGVVPDLPVALSVTDIQTARDRALELAEETLLRKIGPLPATASQQPASSSQ